VDDLADACVRVMALEEQAIEPYLGEEAAPLINIGSGEDISIKELALLVKDVVDFPGEIEFNTEKPDGTFQKLLDVSRINSLGWKPLTELKEGIEKTYDWCLDSSIFTI